MTKLIITDTEGTTSEVEGEVGLTIMEIIRDNDFEDLAAICGGCCSCCTCHVYVDEVWCDKLKIKEDSLEQSLLEYEQGYIPGKSRLACQIQLNDDLNNVTVKLRKNELL